jgi:hypothetical protein
MPLFINGNYFLIDKVFGSFLKTGAMLCKKKKQKKPLLSQGCK